MAYGVPFDEIDTLSEGKQAEEYLKKKLDDKKNQAESDKFKYEYNSNKPFESARRGQGRNYDRYDPIDDILSRGAHVGYSPTTDNNPRYNTARSIRDHRRDYGDVMPGKTKAEKELENAEEKEIKEREYAASMKSSNRSDLDNQIAMDAARRHYRRTHKNESSIFESVEIL